MDNLFDAIFTRKSVRRYQQAPLDGDALAKIQCVLGRLKPLFPDIPVTFEIIEKRDLRSVQNFGAPHFLAAFSKKGRGSYLNIGFMMQQVDLYLSSAGLGSCYLGMAKPSSAASDRVGMDPVMLLAFGKGEDHIHRQPSAFKRKAAEEIASAHPFWLEAVRLAPSATNGQPWYFDCHGDTFDAYCTKQNRLKALMFDRLNGVDMGIALCHLDLAVRHQDRSVSFQFDQSKADTQMNGHVYTISGTIAKA